MKLNRFTYLFLLLISTVCTMRSVAQGICANSALAPVFKQTFGTSTSSTKKNTVPTGFLTNYAFNGSSALADGQYIVTPLVQNSQKNDWAVGGDHTGDVNGNMFLVNAGTGASLFFKQQVDNLCPGSTYSFSAWLVNVNTTSNTVPICGGSYVYPNVTFYIKNTAGVVLQSYNTGNIPFTTNRSVPPNWKQYGFQFSLPAGTTSLVLEMSDFYGGLPQCGNDLAIDDIVFSACTPQATISFTTGNSLCAGSNTMMNSSLANSPFGNPAYQWQKSTDAGISWTNIGTPGTSATNFPLNNITAADGAQYRVLVGPDVSSLSSNTCVTASNVLTLTVNPLPVAAISANNPVCAGSALNLNSVISNGTSPYTVKWTGPGFSSTLANITIPNVSVAANAGMYTLSVTDANFCSATISTTIIVNDLPSIANAGADQSLCTSSSVNLSAITPVTGTGVWTETSGPSAAVIVNPSQNNTVINGLVPGVYKFLWTVSNGVCVSNSDEVMITINTPTASGVLLSNIAVCADTNQGTLTLTGYTGNIIQWESSVDGGASWVVIANTANSYRYQNLSVTTRYRVLVQNNSCPSLYSNTVIVSVNPVTVAGIISADATVCAGANSGTLSLTGNIGTVLQWEKSIDNGASWQTIVNTGNVNAYSNLLVTTLYRSLVQSGNCVAKYTNTVTITVMPVTVPGLLTASATVCFGTNSGTLSLTGNTGSVVRWESSIDNGTSWQNISDTLNTYLYSNLTATTIYRVLVQNNNCGAVYSNTIMITVNPDVIAGLLSGNITVCASANSGTLSVTGYTSNIAQWESSIDNGSSWTVIADTLNNYSYNNIAATTQFRVLVKNGNCISKYSNSVTITVTNNVVSGTLLSDAVVCAAANSGTLSLTGYTGNISQWESSTDNGSSWTVIADTLNTYAFNNIAATTLFRVLVKNGNCVSKYSNSVTITVTNNVVAGTLLSDAVVCAAANSGTLSLTGYTGNIAQWESSIDNGNSWTVIANTLNTYAYNNISASTQFRVLVKNGNCVAKYSNIVTITVSNNVVSGTLSSDAVVCASANSGTISLTGYTGSIAQWESSIDNGSSWTVITDTLNTYAFNNIAATTLFRVLVKNGNCISKYSNTVTITVSNNAVAGTLLSDAVACASANSGTISLTGYTGSIAQWESSTDNGSSWIVIADTLNNYSYNNIAATTQFRVLVKNGNCVSKYSNSVTITVTNNVVAGTLLSDAVICAAANSGTLSLTGYTGNIAQWESSTDNGSSWTVIANTLNNYSYNNIAATTQFRVLVKNGNCVAKYSNSVTITVTNNAVAGILSSDAVVCAAANSGTLSLTGYTGNISQWEYSIDNGSSWTVIANTLNNYSYNNIAATTLFRVLVKNGNCVAKYSNSVTITVTNNAVAGVLSSDAVVCAAANSGTLSLTGYTGNISQWEYSIDNGSSWTVIANTLNNYSYNNIAATTLFRVLVKNGNCVAKYSNSVTITVTNNAVAGVLSSDAVVCTAANNGTLSLTGYTGNISQWESSIDNGSSWTVIANTLNNYSYNNIAATTLFRVLVKNGNCVFKYSNTVTITVSNNAVAGTLLSDAVVCAAANSGTLSLTGYTGNISQWESSTDNGSSWTVIANNLNTYSYNNIAATTLFRVLVKNGNCISKYSNIVTITVSNNAVAGTLSSDAVVCAAANSGTLSLTGYTGNISQWESSTDNGSSWIVIADTLNTHTYNNIAATTQFRVLVKNGNCVSKYSNTVTITVSNNVVTGALSSDAVVCAAANSGTLSLTGYTGNIAQWESSTDNGSSWILIADTLNTYAYNNISATTLFRVLVKNGNCISKYSNTVTIAVSNNVVTGALSSDAVVCAAANSGTISLTGYTGNIAQWESSTDKGSSWTVIADTLNNYAYNNISATTLFRVLVKNGNCVSKYSNTVTITVSNNAVAGALSADAVVCASANSGTLSLTGYTGNISQWESSIDNGSSWTVIANTLNNYAYNNISVTTLFRVLVKNGNCVSKYSNTVTITVSNNVVAGTLLSDAVVCASANSGILSLTGYTGNISQWESSTDNGNSWTVIVDTLNTYAYNNISATTLFRVLVKNGNCVSKYSNSVTITVTNNVVAGTLLSDAVVCASANSGTLSLTGYTGNISQWESSTDNGSSWTVITNTLNNYSYNNIAATTQFRVLVKNGNCISKYSNIVTITVSNSAVAGALSADAVVCASANSGTISLTGYTGNIAQWESSIDNGSSWTVIANTLNTYAYNNINITTLFRVLVKNGSCNSKYSNTVTITVSNNAVAGILSANAVVCAFANNGNLQLSDVSGNIIQWESSTDNGNLWNVIANTSTIYSYLNLSETTQYRVLIKNGNCGAIYTNTVKITVGNQVVPGLLSADTTVCAYSNNGILSLHGFYGNIAQWEYSINNGSSWNIITDTSNTYSYKNLSTSTQYRVLIKNGKCGMKYSNTITITVLNPVTKADAGPDQTLCNTDRVSLNANNPTEGFGKWLLLSGPNSVSFINDSLNNTIITGVTTGTYQFVWTISNRVCINSKDTLSVIISPSIKNNIDTAQQIVCRGQVVIVNGEPVNNATNYQWEKSYDTVNWTKLNNANLLSYSFIPDSTVYIRRTAVVSTCNSISDIVLIKIKEPVSNNIIIGNQTICYNTSFKTIKGSVPTGAATNYNYEWQQSNNNGTSWNTIPSEKAIDLTIDSPLTKTTLYRRLVSTDLCNGPLSNISNTVTITVQPIHLGGLKYKGGAYCSLNTPIDFTPVGDGIDSVKLDFGDGSFIITQRQKISHTYTSAGTYLPAMQILSASNSCIVATPVTDTIRIDTLLIGFKISAVFDCGKTTYRFIDTSSSYFPIVDRKWSINQNPVSTVTTKIFQQSFAIASSNVTGLQLQTQYGCTNSLDAKFDVGIYQYPKADINAIGLQCLNKQVELQSIVNSPDSIKNRTWNLGNGLTATDSVVKVMYYSEGKYIVKLSVATINSCYDSAAKQINIHPTPVITLKQDQIICRGDSLQLTAKGADTYIWKDQLDNVVCFNCSNFTVTPKQNTQYKVVGVTTYGCSEMSNTNIRVIQPFKMTAKLADTICIGQSRQLFVNGASNYSWIPAQGISNLTSSSPVVTPLATTTYKVIGKDNFNCFNDTAQIKITVGNPTPFTVGADTTILSGVPVQLHAVSTLQNIVKWQWKGNATFSCLSCPSPTAKVVFDECLNCTATNIYGCTSTDTVCIKTFCPEAEVFIPNAFSPDGDGINDILFVQGRGLKLIKSFRIYNRWGEMIFEKTNFTPGDKQYGWDGRIKGKPATPDVFVYVCEAICERSVPAIFKGNVAIIK